MRFEWDLAKARANEDKHAVSFEETASIFRAFHINRSDVRRHYGEARFIALGVDSNGEVLNVVYTLRGEAIRIISAWKASRYEREAYAKAQSDRPL
jgi:uncharacterized DUF497 family protein